MLPGTRFPDNPPPALYNGASLVSSVLIITLGYPGSGNIDWAVELVQAADFAERCAPRPRPCRLAGEGPDSSTYVAVVFSIIVQGLTLENALKWDNRRTNSK